MTMLIVDRSKKNEINGQKKARKRILHVIWNNLAIQAIVISSMNTHIY